jgi:hypothetical protein
MRYMEWLLSTAHTNLVTGQRSHFPAVSWPTELLKVVVPVAAVKRSKTARCSQILEQMVL